MTIPIIYPALLPLQQIGVLVSKNAENHSVFENRVLNCKTSHSVYVHSFHCLVKDFGNRLSNHIPVGLWSCMYAASLWLKK